MTTTVQHEFFIGGAWVPAHGADRIQVVDPASGTPLGEVAGADAADVDDAVVAARAAFPAWAATPLEERVGYCTAIALELERRLDQLAPLITHEMGSPIGFATAVQVGLGIIDMASIEDSVQQVSFEHEIGNSLVVRQPIGVVGAITPWNYPLHQITAKVGAAMAAGCTVVVKASEVTPLAAFELARVIEHVGVPAGVVNILTGYGPVAGEAISRHPDIDIVSFTGSARAGRQIAAAAAPTLKRVALELGGKSPYIILDDADLQAAVVNGIGKAYINGGQTCTALTRMLVPGSLLPEVEELVQGVVDSLAVGDPLDPATAIGPMASAAQRDRVVDYINVGLAEGARLVVGGPQAPPGLERGAFVRPTVFSDVNRDMRIVREEIFGPVLVLQTYDDDADAVRVANDSAYGLAGGVFSSSEERATAVARELRTGQVEVNGGAFNPQAPFGGFKHSGYGRELGPYGIEEFLGSVAIQR